MDYGSNLPSNHIFRTHTQRKRERRPLITHAKSKPSKERVLRRPIPHPHKPIPLCRPISINPSLILIDPPPPTHLPPFFSLKDPPPFFSLKIWDLWSSYSVFLFCLYDLVEVVTIICSWLQLICICCDSLVLGKVFEHYLENVSHAKPNIGNTFLCVFYRTQPNRKKKMFSFL